MEKELEQFCKTIEDGVKGLTKEITDIKAKTEELEKSKSVNNSQEIKDLEKKLNDEIAKFQSVKIITPETIKKTVDMEKCKFFAAVARGDFGAIEKIQKSFTMPRPYHEGEMQKTYTSTHNETAGTGSYQMGYFVPEEFTDFYTNFSVLNSGQNSILDKIYTLPMTRLSMPIPEAINGITAGMIGAHTVITASAMSADKKTLTAKKIAAFTGVDLELMQDATPAFLNALQGAARNAFDYRENYLILKGDGSADYDNASVTGILNDTTANVVTMAASGISTVTCDDLLSMVTAISAPIQSGMFVLPWTMLSVIKSLKDDGGYIWKPSDANPLNGTIWGFPVRWINGIMPAYSAIGSGTKFGIFGDFNMGVIKGDRLSLEIAVDNSLYFESYQSALRWVKRLDFAIYGRCFSVLKTK